MAYSRRCWWPPSGSTPGRGGSPKWARQSAHLQCLVTLVVVVSGIVLLDQGLTVNTILGGAVILLGVCIRHADGEDGPPSFPHPAVSITPRFFGPWYYDVVVALLIGLLAALLDLTTLLVCPTKM